MLNAKRPHFFEGFNPTTSSERLKIPSRFIKHLEDKTSGTVSLLGPSGNTWHVDLIQFNDNLFFHDGWAAFVQDHFMVHGDTMVFRYDGSLRFTVQVFDHSSCEKEAAFNAECSQDPNHFDELMGRKRDRVGGDSFLDGIFEHVPKKIRGSQVNSEYIAKNQEGWQHDDVASATEICPATIYAHETGNYCSPSKNAVSVAMPLQSIVPKGNSEARCMLTLSASEAEGLARSFTSCYPNFTKTMKRFNVSGSYTLNIPYQFSMAHFPKCKVKIVLRNLKGESWTVNSVPTIKVHMSHTFCGGWMAFVRDNNINMGDICIFELVGKCELCVYILNVGKEGLECQNGKPTFKVLTNGCAATSHKISERLPKKMRGNASKVSLQLITRVEMSDKKAFNREDKANDRPSKSSAFCSQLKASGKSAIRNKISMEENQGSYTRGCMSMKSAPEEKRAAQSFVSNLPHFVRVMKKFNISGSYTLKVPYQFSMAHLPSCKTEIVLRNLRGQCWTVNSVPSTRVQTLHTFCGGWMAFVRGNDIQMGDICIFELIGKCEMRVYISGVGKKGLDYQSGKVTSNEL